MNRDGEATVWAEKCLEIKPSNIYACLIKSLCIKSVDERIERLKDILEIVSDYARPYNGLGNAYYNNGNYDDAITMYKKSIEINSKYEHPYYGLGSIYNQISNFDESIIWYKRCIEVNPFYDYPLYGLGIAYSNKNDMKNAIYWLERGIVFSLLTIQLPRTRSSLILNIPLLILLSVTIISKSIINFLMKIGENDQEVREVAFHLVSVSLVQREAERQEEMER